MCSISYALVPQYVSLSAGKTSASVSPGTCTRRYFAWMRACSSGVSFGSSRSGSSDGSPTGSEPSGSRRAARWPWVRNAFTSAIAAAMPPRSVSSTSGSTGGPSTGGSGCTTGAGRGGAETVAATWPLPSSASSSSRRASPGCVATSSLAPLSNRLRHSAGTASGFSRYCSRRTPANPAFRPSTSRIVTVFVVAPAFPPGAEGPLEDRVLRQYGDRHPDDEAETTDGKRKGGEARMAAAHRRRHERECEGKWDYPHGAIGDADQAHEQRERCQQPGDRLGWTFPRPGRPGTRGRRQGPRGSRSPAVTRRCACSGGFGSAFKVQKTTRQR